MRTYRGRALACLAGLAWLGTAAAAQDRAPLAILQVAPARGTDGMKTVTIPLDNTGVADWSYLNGRRPPLIDVGTAATPGPVDKLAFVNTTAARTIKVSLPPVTIPKMISGGIDLFESAIGTPGTPPVQSSRDQVKAMADEQGIVLSLDECATAPAGTVCTPTLTLGPGAPPQSISATTLRYYTDKKVLKFTVEFFDDEQQPSRPAGYFVVMNNVQESAPAANWTALGSVQAARDPYYGEKGVAVDAAHPYEGARTAQLKGFGRTTFGYDMGSRASGTVDFLFKNNSALGTFTNGTAEDFTVKASQYSFSVFGMNGVSLKFGKYDFAAPSDGLAIRESGEGATARFRWIGVSRLVRRESQDGTANPDNRDHKAWLFEGTNIPLPDTLAPLRSASLFTVIGDDNPLGKERRYATAGGEVLFGVTRIVEGQLAYYRSRTSPRDASAAPDARGSSYLVKASHGWLKNDHKVARSVSFTAAQGSGDDTSTPNRYEGYLGETAAYSDGSLYLGGIVPRLRVDGDGGFPRRGLMNRRALGLGFTDQTWSALAVLARLVRIPQNDIQSQQTSVRYAHYGFTEQVERTRAGTGELVFETLLESPKNVKYTVRAARAFPGGPLEPLFGKEPWSGLVQCTITLKP